MKARGIQFIWDNESVAPGEHFAIIGSGKNGKIKSRDFKMQKLYLFTKERVAKELLAYNIIE